MTEAPFKSMLLLAPPFDHSLSTKVDADSVEISLAMSRVEITDISASFFAAISAGALSGSMHALTGADHILSLLPLVLNKHWRVGGIYGLTWGCGHGVSSAVLGFAAFVVKRMFIQSTFYIDHYRFLGDLVVAVTLLIIGIVGYYENRAPEENDPSESSLTSPIAEQKQFSYRMILIKLCTVFMHGAALGCSADGLPSLAPAVLLDDTLVITFLLSYLASTAITMSIASGLVSWLSSSSLNGEKEVVSGHRLAMASSLCAISIGCCWLLSSSYRLLTTIMFPPKVNNDNYLGSADHNSSSRLTALDMLLSGGSIIAVFVSVTLALRPPQLAFNYQSWIFHSQQQGGLMSSMLSPCRLLPRRQKLKIDSEVEIV